MRRITCPLSKESVCDLKAGEEVLLEGVIYVARDQAHKRLVEMIRAGTELPLALKGTVIYYMGPAPAPPGAVIGSCGPTTSSRMDAFTPALIERGLKGMIGKGPRARQVIEAMKRHGAVYFHAYGGCGALYAQKVESTTLVAFEDLGPEAIYRLEIRGFPALVGIDARGESVVAPQS
jgi:fumarate hydratase subunit beta